MWKVDRVRAWVDRRREAIAVATVVTALLTIFVLGFYGPVVYGPQLEEGDPPSLFQSVLLGGMGLANFVLGVIFTIDVWHEPRGSRHRTLWIVALLFLTVLAVPAYWYQRVRGRRLARGTA